MLFSTLAAELGPQGVRANTIAPGVVETPLTAPIKAHPEWYQAYADKSILRAVGAALGDGRRRGLPCVRCQQLRHRHDDLRRRWLDGGRRPLRPADLRPCRSRVTRRERASTPTRLVAFTQQLVRIPSVHDPARGLDEQPAAELVAAQMRAFGWEPEIDVVAPGRPNVIAIVDGGGGRGRR